MSLVEAFHDGRS
jgi:hypothetical protein